jgi:GNAT superfamily N-acetyltransferase
MNQLLIRQADTADIPALIDLYVELHAFHVRALPERLRVPDETAEQRDEGLTRHLRGILARKDAVLLVAVREGQVVGLVEAHLPEDEPHPLRVPRRSAYIQSLVVAAAFRGQQIGERLIATAEQWARECGAVEIRLDAWEFTGGPGPFYEALGYRTLKRVFTREL